MPDALGPPPPARPIFETGGVKSKNVRPFRSVPPGRDAADQQRLHLLGRAVADALRNHPADELDGTAAAQLVARLRYRMGYKRAAD